jgi:hypothetical protein
MCEVLIKQTTLVQILSLLFRTSIFEWGMVWLHQWILKMHCVQNMITIPCSTVNAIGGDLYGSFNEPENIQQLKLHVKIIVVSATTL